MLAQTLDDFELIVCDDGSTDGTPVVMAEWAARDPRIMYVRQPRNLGRPGTCVAESPWRRRNLSPSSMTATFTIPACSNDGWPRSAPAPRRRSSSTPTTKLGADGRIEVTYREHLDSCVPGRVLLERLYFRRWHFDVARLGDRDVQEEQVPRRRGSTTPASRSSRTSTCI